MPPEQYVGKHRAAPAPTQPPALAGPPRHVGSTPGCAPGAAARSRKVLRNTLTFGGLAAAATGVAVAAGVLHTPGAPR